MDKSLKNSLHSSSRRADLRIRSRFISKAVLVTAFFFLTPAQGAPKATPAPKPTGLETYQDLILKAQNLTLQRDRLQASQILLRGIQRETRGSQAHKELVKALGELSSVFYSEKAQSAFSVGEAAAEARPREAIEHFQEALRLEDGNVSILKAIARAHLALAECEKADTQVKAAEAIDPHSPEVKLLSLQTLACSRNYESILARLSIDETASQDETDALVKSLRQGLHVQALLRAPKPKNDLKKAKSVMTTWEASAPDYPEVHFWKWEISKLSGAPDRMAAVKYSQACQNLTPRKRKSYSLDVNLCKGKEAVDSYLKDSGLNQSPDEKS